MVLGYLNVRATGGAVRSALPLATEGTQEAPALERDN